MSKKKADSKKKAKLNIVEYDIDKLLKSQAEYNPRAISSENKAGLATSLDKFGYVESIIYNKRTETLVSGHQRLNLLKSKNFDTVDVNVINVDLETEKALNVAMNAKTISGEYTIDVNDLLDEILQTDVEIYDMMNLQALGVYDAEEVELDEVDDDTQVDIPEMDLMPYEHYDCVLVVCRSIDDYMYLTSKLGLEEKRIISAPMVKNKKIGKVRAVGADKLVNLIEKSNE
jgi:hypothetical protein